MICIVSFKIGYKVNIKIAHMQVFALFFVKKEKYIYTMYIYSTKHKNDRKWSLSLGNPWVMVG